jgi:hypothetical protein
MSTDLIQALRAAEIIPHVIPEDQTKSLKCAVKIVYPNVTVSQGEKPARADVLEIPEIEFAEAVSGSSAVALGGTRCWLTDLTLISLPYHRILQLATPSCVPTPTCS